MDFVWDHPSVPAASAFWLDSGLSLASSSSSSGGVRRSYSFSSAARLGDRIGSTSSTSNRSGRENGFVVSRLAGRVFLAVLTCIIAIVGSFVGTITGALIGLATESGMFRGAGIGAISGAVFSIEAVEYSRAVWRSDGSGIWSILFLIDIIVSLLKGTLVREKVGPAMQSAVRSQMSAVDAPFSEEVDIFETGGTCGMSSDSVDRIPKLLITEDNNVDASGEKICCSVCLQDFQSGETVRSLPQCRHMFHLPCIDSWLIRHGSCPLCRRDF